MQFSAFAEFGQFALSSAPCLAQRIYDAIWANLGDNYARGGYTDAKVYATAMALARLLTTQERLDAQISPETVLELLAEREEELGLVVPATATLAERRAALAARMRLPAGDTRPNLTAALIRLLGAGFVEIRTTEATDAVAYPASPGAPGNFVSTKATRRLFRLRDSHTLPTSGPWAFERLDGSVPEASELPGENEWVVVEPEHNVLRERVQLLASGFILGVAHAFGALTKPHHAGARILAGPWPLWASTKRHTVIRVTPEVTADTSRLRQLQALLGQIFRGVSTWSVVDNDGPFLLDESPLDSTPLADP